MSKNSDLLLCIGDEICLYDEEGNELIAEDPLETRACARRVSGLDPTLKAESIGTRIFRVEPQQSYSEQRALEQFIGDEEERDALYYEGSPDELIELSVLEAKVTKERAQNETEKRRLHGTPVLYGEVIQLYNAHFKKYLTVTGQTCKSDVSHLQVNLSKDVVGYFRIVPRYRIRVDGEPVRLGDTVAIKCLRPEGFLNVGTKALHSGVFSADYYEVFTHSQISSWTLRCHRSSQSLTDTSNTKCINAGQYIRFYHKEMEGYLESSVLRRDKNGVRLTKHIINPLDPKETDSPLAFWEIENADPSDGSKVQWKRSIRIRHAASRAYLYIDSNNVSIDMNTHKVTFSFGLVKNPKRVDANNDATLFKFLPVSTDSQRSGVPFGSFVRIQHVLTKCWMHAAADEELRSSTSPVPMAFTLAPDPLERGTGGSDLPADPTEASHNPAASVPDRYYTTDPNLSDQLQQSRLATPTYQVTASQDFYYHDCFSITLVSNRLTDTFNVVNEFLPQLQWFLCKDRSFVLESGSRFPISTEEYKVMSNILNALVRFCTNSKETDPSLRVGLPDEYHQALLRDIGLIETVINMIQIPFDLAKRYEVRSSLGYDTTVKQEGAKEDAVSIVSLHDGSEERLKEILALCYNVLRIFLIGSYEEDQQLARNQHHIIQVAGDAGIELFMRHLTCGVGATDMVVRLLQNNSSVIEAISGARPHTVGILVNLATEKTRAFIRRLVRCDDGYISETKQDYEAASGLDLLSTLCHTDKQGSLTYHRDYISARLFSVENCLLQMRMAQEEIIPGENVDSGYVVTASTVEINFLHDNGAWRNLETLLRENQASVTVFIESALHLVYSVSWGTNAKSLEAIRRCIGKDVCLTCLGDVRLPDQIRSKFCDLLTVLYIDVPPFTQVVLSDFTMQYENLDESNDYPSGGTGSFESKSPEFFDHLKRWTLVFLDDKRHQFTAAKHEVEFLSSVLKMMHAQLRLGFFTDDDDVKRIFRALILVLDGRSDARNEEHLKSIKSDSARRWKERFILTEETQPVMNTKILILEIFDLIFDLRLHVRMKKLASKWKAMETKVDNELQHSPHAALNTIFTETMLRQRENILMPIIKDILKYQYAPLKRIAAIVMHRIYSDSEDLFSKAQQVLLLSQPQHVFVYHGVKKRLALLGSFLSVDRLGPTHLPQVEAIVRELIDLFRGKTIDFNDEAIQLENNQQDQRNIYCKVFTNLSAHSMIIQLLGALKGLPAKTSSSRGSLASEDQRSLDYPDEESACITAMKTCLEFFDELVKDDKDLQSQLVLENIDLLIDVSAFSPILAATLYPICQNNLHISIRIREEHLQRILELSRGFQKEYFYLLVGFMKAQGKLLKKHQDCVMRFIMENRQLYVPFESHIDLKATDRMDYCISLMDLLAVCGQGGNTFGQSFARTILGLRDITAVIEDPDAPLGLKAGVFRFFVSIYLDNTEVLSNNVPVSDEASIRTLMKTVYREMIEARHKNTDPETMDYVYNGLLVFLRSIFEYHLSVETSVDETLYLLCPQLVDLTVDLMATAPEGTALNHTLACLDSMINVAGFRGSVDPAELRVKLREAMVERSKPSTAVAKIRPLDSINTKFQGFIRAVMAHKDVRHLMESEFKRLGFHFNLSVRGSDQDVKSLIDYLSMTTSVKRQDSRESYQVSTIKLLEEIPLKYIRERSTIAHLDDPGRYELLEKKKTHAQNTLNRLGCTLVAQNLLSSPRRAIFEAALKLLIALLEGGNKNVQDKLEEYFYSIREERFFYSFHHRLQSGIASLKEAQLHLSRAAYKMNRQQSIMNVDLSPAPSMAKKENHRQKKKNRSSLDVTRSHIRKRMLLNGSNSNTGASTGSRSKKGDANSAMVYQKISNLMASETAEFGTASEDFKAMTDTMRAVQLMVEGHNINLQTYLARQPDNIKSFNIVQDVVEYLHAIVPICNIQNVRLIIQVLDTITELAQGCIENQVTIYAGKILNPANTILRERYTNCPTSLINELKSKVAICLLSLLEGGIDNSETIFREMAASLDLNVVVQNMNAIYDKNADQLESPDAYEKLDCGFQYCILLMTLWPALDESQRILLDGNRAFEFFQSHTGKIEVVMDYNQEKQLSRVLFPIPEVCKYLREDTKQRFLWSVKRDSPSAKIENFVQLSDNIIYEIDNHAKVARNQYLSLLSRYSAVWWRASYAMTILLNLLVLSCSSYMLVGDNDSNGYCYRFKNVARVFFGLFHLLFWLLSTTEFYCIQLPILVNRHSVQSETAAVRRQDATGRPTDNRSLTRFLSHKDIRFILASLGEQTFLYHITMLVFSLLGLYSPGFYSIHLLDFAFRDRILQGVIASITLNVSSITRTAILGVIVVYIHSVVAYVFFREEFDVTKGLHCSTLTQCFVTALSHGVRSGGGIGDILEPDALEDPRGWRTAFEMSFFLLVVVFLLNAIFGIIFDTFGHLRDERSSIQHDMKNTCFICSIPSVEFQRLAKKGFEDHVRHDHNIWQYLFFLVHLKTKDRTEYTGPESYVSECLKEANYSFFPVNRALCLKQGESDDGERLEKLEEVAQMLLQKVNGMEEHIEKLADMQSRSRSNSLMLSPM
ncbi:hypothetical protein BDB00DRAFT_822221 [Zychaea mexicana]|uniref:uncharacterized protein n=1 Tax=Zychaea mexicana TaxID=64656 RepID=UPI0022FDB98B|nr:uncharacterized protein BDB00DRAFT_822221 [Zychaea mexicana]KAI9493708.1 hypothetical protein BDB00DRAFT_822221 [Zychaea mexicana]